MILWLIGLWSTIATQHFPGHVPELKSEFSVQISGFPIDSIANNVSTLWYNINGIEMVKTMIGENGGFDKDIVSITNDHGLCQLNYKRHKDFINSENFRDPMIQAQYCAEVWQDAVKKKRLPTTFYAYNHRGLYTNRISVLEKRYYEIFRFKIYKEECLILKNGKQQSCRK